MCKTIFKENIDCRQITKNRRIATPTRNKMRNLLGMILVQYEKNLLKTVGCERIFRKSLLNTQINDGHRTHSDRYRFGSERA